MSTTPPFPADSAITRRRTGCSTPVAAVVVVVVVTAVGLLGIAAVVVVVWKADAVLRIEPCAFLSSPDATAVLGGKQLASELDNIAGGGKLDDRLLGDAPTCRVSDQTTQLDSGLDAQVSRYRGDDAAGRFAAGRELASRGRFVLGGATGDATAFCTSSDSRHDAVGALVLRGDTLIYAAVLNSTLDGTPVPDDVSCLTARRLADRVQN